MNIKKSITLAAISVLSMCVFSTSAHAEWSGGSDLRRDVYRLDQVADQMVRQFTLENCGCKDSVILLQGLRTFKQLTGELVFAHNGSCKKTFEKAACRVDDAIIYANRNNLITRAELSRSMKSSIDQAITLAKNIHRNADYFVPKTSYSQNPRNDNFVTSIFRNVFDR